MMKKTRFLALLLAGVAVLSAALPASAAGKQKAGGVLDTQAIAEELQRRFDGLTKKEKDSLYDIAEETEAVVQELLARYVELGVLSRTEAIIARPILRGMIKSPRAEGQAPTGLIIMLQ